MSCSRTSNSTGLFSEPFDFSVKPWNLHVQDPTLRPTRSNTPDSNTPDNASSDSTSEQDFSVGSLTFSDKTDSSPTSSSRFEIDVKPKRKKFASTEERKQFVEDYKRKHKTELCKNWELRGNCKFGDKCCFAHGRHELKSKTVTHDKYKTKPCKQYHQSSYCPYGQRCQYLHKEAVQPNIFFTPCQAQTRDESYTYEDLNEINKLCATDSELDKILARLPTRPRLNVFGKVAVLEP